MRTLQNVPAHVVDPPVSIERWEAERIMELLEVALYADEFDLVDIVDVISIFNRLNALTGGKRRRKEAPNADRQ